MADRLGACSLHVVSSDLAALPARTDGVDRCGGLSYPDRSAFPSVSCRANRPVRPEGPRLAIRNLLRFALAGLALCAVGIYDRKRSAIWVLLVVLSLVVCAVHDTLIWFNLFSASMPLMDLSGCLLLLAVGFIRRCADPPAAADLRESSRIPGQQWYSSQPQHRAKAPPRRQSAPAACLRACSCKATSGGRASSTPEATALPTISIGISPPAAVPSAADDALFLAMPSTPAFHRRYKRCQDDELRQVAN